MIKYLRELFSRNIHVENDELIWAVAEALLWIEENPSAGAIPESIHKQPEKIKNRLYADAKYLCGFVVSKLPKIKKRENPSWRLKKDVDTSGELLWKIQERSFDGCGGSRFLTQATYKDEKKALAAYEHVRWEV